MGLINGCLLAAMSGWRAELMSPHTFLKKPLVWLQVWRRAHLAPRPCLSTSPSASTRGRQHRPWVLLTSTPTSQYFNTALATTRSLPLPL